MEHRITQSWWNGQFGDLGRIRLRLHMHVLDDGEHWAVEYDTAATQLAYPCDSEQQAHDTVEALMAENPGEWRRVDPAALGEGG